MNEAPGLWVPREGPPRRHRKEPHGCSEHPGGFVREGHQASAHPFSGRGLREGAPSPFLSMNLQIHAVNLLTSLLPKHIVHL